MTTVNDSGVVTNENTALWFAAGIVALIALAAAFMVYGMPFLTGDPLVSDVNAAGVSTPEIQVGLPTTDDLSGNDF